jgi:gluconate 2-dehydrogenase gamma chain
MRRRRAAGFRFLNHSNRDKLSSSADAPTHRNNISSTSEETFMAKHDESRRAFLVGAAVGAGAVAGTGMVSDALAQQHRQHHAAPVQAKRPIADPKTTGAAPAAHAHDAGEGHGAFLNDENAATVAAFAERLMPGAPGKPGARDAGVLNYIDLALAGAYSDQQDFYRRGLAALDAYCKKTFSKPFVELSPSQQDEVITALEQGKASEFTYPSAQAFFNAIRTHTMEGMFADPIYGGNKDFAGWKLVGFPGAQPYFTEADMQSKQAFNRAPITGLQATSRKV